MKLGVKRILTLAFVLLVLLALFLPLRIVFEASGLASKGISARSIEGSVWSGTIRDLRLGRLALGDMDAALSPLALLRGDIVLGMTRAQDAADRTPLAFDLGKSGNRLTLRNAKGEVPASDLLAPLPVRSVALDGVNITFDGKACTQSSGAVRINIEQSLFGITLQRGLSGTIRCEGAGLLLPLQGQSGMEMLDIRLTGEGRYTADFSLSGLSSGMGEALGALGFHPQGDGMAITINGRL